jgi:hypothetical protein
MSGSKCYEPPVKLGKDGLGRLKELSFSPSLAVLSPFFSGGGGAAVAVPDVPPLEDDIVLGSGLDPHLPGGAGPSANGSLALQAIYENNAVKRAFFEHPPIILNSDTNDDIDEIKEDTMDPIMFARYYAVGNLLMAKIVRDHDQAMRERLNQGIANWIGGVNLDILKVAHHRGNSCASGYLMNWGDPRKKITRWIHLSLL